MKIVLPEKAKRISLDMLINLLGTGIILATLQFFINPNVMRHLSAELYGEMQSVMSMVFLLTGTLGGALSTVRLIQDHDYNEKKVSGDFNILLLCCAAATVGFFPIIYVLYFHKSNALDVFLVLLVALSNLAGDYFGVGLRIRLDYKNIFLNQLVTCVGYGIGYAFFLITKSWTMIYIVCNVLRTLHSIRHSDLIHEPLVRTSLIKGTARSFGDLSVASLLGRALTYFDKMLLYPLLGGTAVSIYYVANIFGKLIIQALQPITSVVLSYIAKQRTVSGKLWHAVIGIGSVSCALMYFVCILISKPIIFFLYPELAAEAIVLVPMATLSMSVSAFAVILSPFILKMMDTKVQMLINGSGLVVYVVCVLYAYQRYGLMGCAVSMLISNVVKVAFMIGLSLRKRYEKHYSEN